MKFLAVKSLDEVSKLTKFLMQRKGAYSLDLETTGKSPWADKIVGAGFCWDERGSVYVPFRHAYDQPFDGERALQLLYPVFANVPYMAYNAVFETDFLEISEKLPRTAECLDVGLLAYVNAIYPAMSLKAVAEVECPKVGVMSYGEFMDSQKLSRNKNNIAEASVGAVTDYCGRDALAAFLIYKKLYPVLKNNKVYKLEKAVLPVTKQLRRNGVLIDKKYFEEESQRLTEYLDTLKKLIEAQVSERAGKSIEFNIDSNQQLAEVLFDVLKLPCDKYTPKGARQTNKDVLSVLKWKEPIVKNIVSYKEISKRRNTYYIKYVAAAQRDGRIHASYNQSGVPSGRFSCSDPNLQNLPRKETWNIYSKKKEFPELEAHVRRGYVVPDDCWLLELDFSQIEARIAAGATGESILLEAFRDGVDFHAKTASLVFNVPVESVTKTQRMLGKTLNFTLIFGAGAETFYYTIKEEMDITYEQAVKLREKYLDSYAQMFHGAEMIANEAQSRHYVQTFLGRRVPIFLFESQNRKQVQEARRMAYNQIVQGTAADIVKVGMVKSYRVIVDKYGLDKVKLILMSHDALAFEIKKSVDLVTCIKELEKVMHYKLSGFPDCFVGVSLGRNWGALEDKEDDESVEAFVARVTGSAPAIRETGSIFVLEIPESGAGRTEKQVVEFAALLQSVEGDNQVILKFGKKETLLPYKTGVTLKDRNKILLIMGGKFYQRSE